MKSRRTHIREYADRFYDLTEASDAPLISLDLLRLLTGDKMGDGAYRNVYEFTMIKNTVIKIAVGNAVKANFTEFAVWNEVRGTEFAKWFAPCLYISPASNFLIQRKVRKVSEMDALPSYIPSFFTDLKKENFGFIGKQLVCVDYQFLTRAMSISMSTSRKVKWD